MHFASLWESIADAVPDHLALVHGECRRTWQEYEARASRLARIFDQAGLGPTCKIGIYLYNCPEYLETQFAALKIRAVPVNVNYRYVDDELSYLLDNADVEALVYDETLEERVLRVRPRLPKLRLLISTGPRSADPGVLTFEDAIARSAPMPRIARREDDIYMLYTGGTTGMPKGVMYSLGDITRSFLSSSLPLFGVPVPDEGRDLAASIKELVGRRDAPVSLPTCPFMHGTGMWIGAIGPSLAGATIVTVPSKSFDAHAVLATTQRERVRSVVLVGDVMSRPLVRELDQAAAAGEPYDTSCLQMIVSSGAMWSAEVKEALLARLPRVTLVDAFGSTEGSLGVSVTTVGSIAPTATFRRSPTTKVFTPEGRIVAPGSGEAGLLATSGLVPVGYYKDPDKSASSFRTIEGVRYSCPGDWATVDEDGTIHLLGRGNQCINTGGEKVFPEEVEEAVKRMSGVEDCLIVGIADDRYGQTVAAVISTIPGRSLREADVVDSVRQQLAAYKAPRRIIFVDRVPRAENGKADYRRAVELVRTPSEVSGNP